MSLFSQTYSITRKGINCDEQIRARKKDYASIIGHLFPWKSLLFAISKYESFHSRRMNKKASQKVKTFLWNKYSRKIATF